jgi:3-phenylpropionate/trans-cinnamate dioxygenase ferredoxin subunit
MKKRHFLCRADEIPEKGLRAFEVAGKAIAVCRINGAFYAFDEICTHQDVSLAEGWLEGFTIECPMHGAQFDVRTGDALSLPATESLATYPVVVEDGKLFVELDHEAQE